MRIALLAGWYYPDSVGGTEAYVQALARDLQTAGHAAAVVAPSINDRERRYVHDDVPVFRYPITVAPSRARIRNDVPPPAAELEAFETWLDEWQPDVVHMHSITGALGVHHARAVTRRELPLFVTAHLPGVTCPRGTLMRWGTTPCDGAFSTQTCGACCLHERGLPRAIAAPMSLVSRTPAFRRAPGRIGTMLQYANGLTRNHERTMEILRLADRVIVVCDWLRDVMRRNGVPDERLLLSRHGLPPASRAPAARPRRPRDRQSGHTLRIGFIGRFDPIKGAHVLVEGFRGLPRELPIELHLYGVAPGAQRTYVDALHRAGHGDGRIVFGAQVDEAERSRLLRTWDMLAVPSIAMETGPLVVLEAFAAGIPVVGSALGGIAELVTHGRSGLLVAPGDASAWRDALGEARRRFASNEWDWDIPPVRRSEEVAAEMLDVYATSLRTAGAS